MSPARTPKPGRRPGRPAKSAGPRKAAARTAPKRAAPKRAPVTAAKPPAKAKTAARDAAPAMPKGNAKGAPKPAARKAAGRPGAAAASLKRGSEASGRPASGAPGTAGKADGDAAVTAWMEGVKPAHLDIVRRLDILATESIPNVVRAVKWSMPMYGVKGQGWVAHIGSFKDFVALGFFDGASLKPEPPEKGQSPRMRRVRFGSLVDLDEHQVRSWLQQAATMPGWGTV